MANNINVAMVSGNLTRDAELRMTQSGTPVLNFGIACNRSIKNQQTGEWVEKPDFIDCVMFGNRAQGIAQYLRKGVFAAVVGRLAYSSWTDKDTGKNRSKIELAVTEVNFYGTQAQQAPQQAYQPAQQYQQPAYQPQPPYQQQPAYQPQAYQQPAYQQAPQPMPAPAAPQTAPMPAPAAQPPVPDVYDEDIPF